MFKENRKDKIKYGVLWVLNFARETMCRLFPQLPEVRVLDGPPELVLPVPAPAAGARHRIQTYTAP